MVLGRGQLTLTDMNDVVASATKPTTTMEGALWYDTVNQKLFVYQSGDWRPSSNTIVGGRNLIKNSTFKNGKTGWSGHSNFTIIDPESDKPFSSIAKISATGLTETAWFSLYSNYFTAQAGNDYTFSVDMKVTDFAKYDSTVPFIIEFYAENTGVGRIQSRDIYLDMMNIKTLDNGKWYRLSYTFKPTAETINYGRIRLSLFKNGEVFYREVKVEQGNIPTDWTEASEDLDEVITDVTETLGNMANDNLITIQERQVIKDKLTDITGYVIADGVASLPSVSTLDAGSNGKGSFYFVRRNAIASGLSTTDTRYVAMATAWENAGAGLKPYLEGLTPVKPWDVSANNSDKNVSVTKATFRDRWLKYYQAEKDLANATADQLKKNVDNIEIGGANYASNGDFSVVLDKAPWKDSYAGQLKEIVDISTDRPPFKYAMHVKNTTAQNGGIFIPNIWTGLSATALVNKEITISFWLKYTGILLGANSWNAGRFGEVIIEGETASGSKVYGYTRSASANADSTNNNSSTDYILGTDNSWKKYTTTHKLILPSGTTKITRVSFKHGIEGAVGEFWTTGIQIEVGNKATDWKMSDSDMAEKITNVEFKVTDESIIGVVTGSQKYQATVKELQDSIDNIQIGGRNLIVANSILKGFWIDDTGSTISLAESWTSDYIDVSQYKQITFSTNGRHYFQRVAFYNSSKTFISPRIVKTASGVFTYTHDVPSGAKFVRVSSDNWDVGYFKLESGNKATDWTPAPEDTAKDISLIADRTTKVEDKVTDTKIVQTVTSSTEWGNKADKSNTFTKDEIAQMTTAQLIHNTEFKKYSSATSVTNWSLSSGWSLDTSKTFEGSNTIKSNITTLTANTWRALQSEYRPATAGEEFIGSFYVYADDRATDSPATGWHMEIEFFNGNTRIASFGASIKPSANGVWERFSKSAIAPANTTQVRLRAHPVMNGVFWIAKPMLSRGKVLTNWTPHIDELATELSTKIEQTDNRVSIVVSEDNKIKGDSVATSLVASSTAMDVISKNINLTGKVTINSFDKSTQDAFSSKVDSEYVKQELTALGDFTNYTSWNKTDEPTTIFSNGSRVVRDTSKFRSSSASLRFPTNTTGVGYKKYVPVIQGDIIYYELYVMTDSDWNGTSGNSKLRFGNQNGDFLFAKEYNGVKSSWTKISGTYTVPSGVSFLKITLGNDGTVGNVWIDDVVVSKQMQGQLITDSTKWNTASENASNAVTSIADMSSDSKVTPVEKVQLKKEWATISAEKPSYEALANTYGIGTEKTNYVNAYNTLNTALNGSGGILTNMTTTSSITATTFRAQFDDYYDKKAILNRKISETSRSIGTGAQNTIDEFQVGGRNIIVDSNNFFDGILNYGNAVRTTTRGVAVTEWGATDATRIVTTGGTNDLKFYKNILQPSESGQVYTNSVWIKNNGTANVRVNMNLTSSPVTVAPNESKRITMTSKGNGTSHLQFKFYTSSSSSINEVIDVTLWRMQSERSSKASDWTAAPEDNLIKFGDNKWQFYRYNRGSHNPQVVPTYDTIINLEPTDSYLVDDGAKLIQTIADNYIGYLKTAVYVNTAKTISFAYQGDDANALLANGKAIRTSTVSGMSSTVNVPLNQGWNTIEFIWVEGSGADGIFNISNPISSQVDMMSCYFAGDNGRIASVSTAVNNAQTSANNAQKTANNALTQGLVVNNPVFESWNGNFPSGLNSWGTSPTKETTLTRSGNGAMRWSVTDAAVEAGASINSGYFIPNLPNNKYYFMEVDYMLVSGTITGAGLLLDWQGLSPYRTQIAFSSFGTPELGKWHTARTVLKRPTDNAGYTGMWGYIMANFNSLGGRAVKNFIVDRIMFREATQEEIKAYESDIMITNMSSDSKITPVEKVQLKKEWATIVAEKPQYEGLATTYAITTEKTNYVNAYNTLNTALNGSSGVLVNMNTTSDINGTTFRAQFDDYYDKKAILTRKVNETSRTIGTGAQTAIDNLEIGARNLIKGTKEFEPSSFLVFTGMSRLAETERYNGLRIAQATGDWGSVDFKIKTLMDAGLLKVGDVATFSTYGRIVGGTATDKKPMIYFSDGDKSNTTLGDLTSEWKRYSITFTVRESDSTNNVSLRFETHMISNTNINFQVAGYKLEKGNRATDYTEAPEDLDGKIGAVETTANGAKQAIADMTNDNIIAPVEKLQLKKEWATITAEKPSYEALATTYGITTEKTNYTNAYNALSTAISPILSNMTTNSSVTGSTFRNTFDDYYDKMAQLMKKVNELSRNIGTGAQNTADAVKGVVSNFDSSLINANPIFLDWSGTYPAGYPSQAMGTGSSFSKVTSGNGMGNALKFVVAGGTNAYLNGNQVTNMPYYQYITAEVTFMLESGTLGGAGVLFRVEATYDIDNKFHLKDSVASPITGKWYTVTKTFKLASATPVAGFTGYTTFPMGGWGSFGTVEAKTIQFDSIKVRASTDNEIRAYDTEYTVTSKLSGWDKAYDRVTGWTASGKTTIDGGMIETNTIKAQQIGIGDFTNYNQLNEFSNPSTYTVATVNGNTYFKIGQGAYATVRWWQSTTPDFKVGDELFVSFYGYKDTSVTNVDFVYRYYYTDGTWSNGGVVKVTPSSVDSRVTGTIIVTASPTATKTLLRADLFTEKDSGTTGYYYMREVEIRKRLSGDLIVDGAITADKINGKTITGVTLSGGTVYGGTINGSRIVSSSKGEGIATLDGGSLEFKNISGAITKNITITGDSITASPNLTINAPLLNVTSGNFSVGNSYRGLAGTAINGNWQLWQEDNKIQLYSNGTVFSHTIHVPEIFFSHDRGMAFNQYGNMQAKPGTKDTNSIWRIQDYGAADLFSMPVGKRGHSEGQYAIKMNPGGYADSTLEFMNLNSGNIGLRNSNSILKLIRDKSEVQVRTGGDGAYCKIIASDFQTGSLRETKTYIEDTKLNALEELNRLRVREYYLKAELGNADADNDFKVTSTTLPQFSDAKKRLGFIYEEIANEMLKGDDSVKMYEMIALAIKGIQELTQENVDLKIMINELKETYLNGN